MAERHVVIWDPRSKAEQTAGVNKALDRLDRYRAAHQPIASEPTIGERMRRTQEAEAAKQGKKRIRHLNEE